MNTMLFTILMSLFQITANNSTNAPLHEFYISVTKIDHNSSTQSLEITSSLYIDDLEKAIESQKGVQKLYLGTDKENPKADEYILNYLSKNVGIVVNEKKTTLNYVGKEVEIDKILVYYEITNIKDISSIKIKNELLLDVAKSQENIVHVKYNSRKKSLRLRYNETEGNLAF